MEEFLHKALFVEDINDDIDLNSVPTSGQEYLKRVIFEARKCESVVVANIDEKKLKAQTVRFSSDSGCPPAPKEYIPAIDWQLSQVSQFSELRSKMARHAARLKHQGIEVNPPKSLPSLEQQEHWFTFCYGKSSTDKADSAPGNPPLLPIIMSLNQYKVETLLEYNAHWLEESGFSQLRGQWIYALLAKLEKPLKPEMCSLIRSIARTCCTLRSRLPTADDPFLPQLNLFIALVGRYFDQTDLADP